MAITWEFTITPIDVPNKIVGVSATRTDDALTNPDPEYTVTMQNADISTGAKKTDALNTLWAKYQKKAAEQAVLDSVAVEISTMEANAKSDFEWREP